MIHINQIKLLVKKLELEIFNLQGENTGNKVFISLLLQKAKKSLIPACLLWQVFNRLVEKNGMSHVTPALIEQPSG